MPSFTQLYLKEVLQGLREEFGSVPVKDHGLTWTSLNRGRRHYFFHVPGPEHFFWEGRAFDANEARAEAWLAWGDKQRRRTE